MRFASKQQLLEQIDGEHDRLLELLALVPKSRYREEGVWGDGWTIHDLVAHLAEWQLMFLRWYREGRDGVTPALPAPGYKWNELPGLNRAIWRKHHGRACARVMREFEGSYRQIRALVSRLPPKALLAPGHFKWTGKYPLTTYLAPNTCSHYRFASKILRRWLRGQTVAASPAARSRTRTASGAAPGRRGERAAGRRDGAGTSRQIEL